MRGDYLDWSQGRLRKERRINGSHCLGHEKLVFIQPVFIDWVPVLLQNLEKCLIPLEKQVSLQFPIRQLAQHSRFLLLNSDFIAVPQIYSAIIISRSLKTWIMEFLRKKSPSQILRKSSRVNWLSLYFFVSFLNVKSLTLESVSWSRKRLFGRSSSWEMGW